MKQSPFTDKFHITPSEWNEMSSENPDDTPVIRNSQWQIQGVDLIQQALEILSTFGDDEVKDWKAKATVWLKQ